MTPELNPRLAQIASQSVVLRTPLVKLLSRFRRLLKVHLGLLGDQGQLSVGTGDRL